MIPIRPYRTENTFHDNTILNRSLEVRRDTDSVKNAQVALYDIDYAVMWHIRNKIAIKVVENGTALSVPLVYANAEKWHSVRALGYLRDNKQKMLAPVMMISRTGVAQRPDLIKNDALKGEGNTLLLEKKYSQDNRYDKFSLLNGRKPVREFYSVQLPRHVDVTYDLMCWGETVEQLNEMVEQLLYYSGEAFGDTYKFITYIEQPNFETTNNPGEDRLVRATFTLRTKAQLIPENLKDDVTTKKSFSVNKFIVTTEVDTALNTMIINTGANQTTVVNNTVITPPTPSALQSNIITFLNTNVTVNSDSISSTYADFNGVQILSSPGGGIPDPDKYSFTYFINGQYISPALVTSIINITSTSVRVTFNTTILGYILESTDTVTVSGKFSGSSDASL